MEKNIAVVTALLTLVIGFGAGYVLSGDRAETQGLHVMSDGFMMGNDSIGMGTAMDDMISGLDGKTGDAFDRAFLNEMIVHHQGAVEMAQAALQDAKHQEIKDLAQKIITAQNAEIKEMQDWQKGWYGIQQ